MTAQAPDILIYNDECLPLFSNPLEPYWNDEHPRPRFPSRTTANYRGYVATWEIVGDELYLTDIEGFVLTDRERKIVQGKRHYMMESVCRPMEAGEQHVAVTLDILFPQNPGRVFASWATGVLRIPQGKLLHYEHMAYGSQYERDLLLTVREGRVVETEVVDNTSKPYIPPWYRYGDSGGKPSDHD